MRGWIRLEVEFTKIDFQKESNLLNKFERVLSDWNILEIVLFGKFCRTGEIENQNLICCIIEFYVLSG